MLNKIFYFLFIFIFIGFGFFSVQAQGIKDAFKTDGGSGAGNLNKAASTIGYDTGNAEAQINTKIADVISAFLSFLGIIFIILMIYGGYLWMTDRGNEDQVKKAKDLIASAIIGLLVIVSAYAVSYFVIKYFTESTLS